MNIINKINKFENNEAKEENFIPKELEMFYIILEIWNIGHTVNNIKICKNCDKRIPIYIMNIKFI